MNAIINLAWAQLWQVTLVVLTAGLLTKLFCRRRPHLAYILWMIVLVKCVTPPLWSSPTGFFSWTNRLTADAIRQRSIEPGLNDQTTPPHEESRAEILPVSKQAGIANSNESAAYSSSSQPINNGSFDSSRRSTFIMIVAIIWSIGMISYLCFAIGSVLRCARVIKQRQVPFDPSHETLVNSLTKQLRIRQRVKFTVVDADMGPMTFGWLRPTIVIPKSLVLLKPVAEIEPILAHELIHVRRADSLVGLLQIFVQALWWFHPLVWWTNRSIRYERERCCDEEVVAGLSYEPVRYARSLLDIIELKQTLHLPSAIPGIRPFEITKRRLEYLVAPSTRFQKRMPRLYWFVFIVGLCVIAPGAGLRPSPLHADAVEAAPIAIESPPVIDQPIENDTSPFKVTGRVINQQGEPVADAEVILLGQKRIVVDASNRKWSMANEDGNVPPSPLSTRTNANGEFSIVRTSIKTNRLAVIAQDPLLYVIPREELGDGENVEIKLPPSGSLAISCDLPRFEKGADIPVDIELRTYNGEDWNVDRVRFSAMSTNIKNQAVVKFEHLPPATYAVQWGIKTHIKGPATSRGGKNGELTISWGEGGITMLNFADRKTVDIVSNKNAEVEFNRKVGKPLTINISGIDEDIPTIVTISYLGSEERLGIGKAIRWNRIFEVRQVKHMGEFQTDPIPPGKYHLRLAAAKSNNPHEFLGPFSQPGYKAELDFTVPENGEMRTLEVKAEPAGKIREREPDKWRKLIRQYNLSSSSSPLNMSFMRSRRYFAFATAASAT